MKERFASAESDPVQKGIGANFAQKKLRSRFKSALRIVRLGILTPWAVVRAALDKQRVPQSRSIDD